jgi:hypothetical protein
VNYVVWQPTLSDSASHLVEVAETPSTFPLVLRVSNRVRSLDVTAVWERLSPLPLHAEAH